MKSWESFETPGSSPEDRCGIVGSMPLFDLVYMVTKTGCTAVAPSNWSCCSSQTGQ